VIVEVYEDEEVMILICLVFKCEFEFGVCCVCYGCGMVIGSMIELGDVVGIIVV